MAELARLAAITKTFGGVRALRGVNFEVQTGEVHALVGENGAGKSTLMRVLGGEMTPSSGEVSIDGETCRFPRAARSARPWHRHHPSGAGARAGPFGGGEHLPRRTVAA